MLLLWILSTLLKTFLATEMQRCGKGWEMYGFNRMVQRLTQHDKVWLLLAECFQAA